jgi:hypothetical protein
MECHPLRLHPTLFVGAAPLLADDRKRQFTVQEMLAAITGTASDRFIGTNHTLPKKLSANSPVRPPNLHPFFFLSFFYPYQQKSKIAFSPSAIDMP